MEEWKLNHLIVNFTEACQGDPHDLIHHAKALRRVLDKLNNPAQETAILDAVVPLLDHDRAEVRQCAFCVILNLPIEALSTMPESLHIQRLDKHGNHYYDHQWNCRVPPEQHNSEWMEYAARHMVHLQDRHGYRPGR